MKIYLPKKITNFKIYNEVLFDFANYYLSGKKENPVISFENTERIDYSSIPVIMGILDVIYNVKDDPVELDFLYRPTVLYLLEHSLFFYYADTKLGYINYNKDIVGGLFDYVGKKYRSVHKIHVYEPFKDFYTYNVEKQENIRRSEYEKMRYHRIGIEYDAVLEDIKKLWPDQMENLKTILAELITNSILYSYSLCYVILYSDRNKTMISICDVGIGYKTALTERIKNGSYKIEDAEKFEKYKQYIEKKYTKYKLDDFFEIMESLYYSELQNKINTFYLKKLISQVGGSLRIHTKATQVLFNNKCVNCNGGIIDCMECLLKRITNDLQYSPVKIFNSIFKGVRIEIEFSR